MLFVASSALAATALLIAIIFMALLASFDVLFVGSALSSGAATLFVLTIIIWHIFLLLMPSWQTFNTSGSKRFPTRTNLIYV